MPVDGSDCMTLYDFYQTFIRHFLNSFSGGFIRQINKDIEITVDGTRTGFRLTKPDAFSGVTLLRLLMRLEEKDEHPTMLDPVSFLSVEELHSVMTAVPNHTSVLLPAGRKQRQIPTPLNGTITVYPATERRSPERFSSSCCKEKDGIIRWVFSFEAGVVQPYMWLFISVIMHST